MARNSKLQALQVRRQFLEVPGGAGCREMAYARRRNSCVCCSGPSCYMDFWLDLLVPGKLAR